MLGFLSPKPQGKLLQQINKVKRGEDSRLTDVSGVYECVCVCVCLRVCVCGCLHLVSSSDDVGLELSLILTHSSELEAKGQARGLIKVFITLNNGRFRW